MQKFTLQIRGNVLFESQEKLLKAISETLKSFPEFKLTYQAVEVWTDPNGVPKEFAEESKENTQEE